MTQPFTPNSHSTDADIAYNFLLAQGHSRNYQDIIQEVFKARNLPFEPGKGSGILTEINLDTRFNYLGKGEWGLQAWVASKGSKKSSAVSSVSKGSAEDDDEEDLDEEKDLLVGEDFEEEERDLHEHEAQEIPYKKSSKRSHEDSWN